MTTGGIVRRLFTRDRVNATFCAPRRRRWAERLLPAGHRKHPHDRGQQATQRPPQLLDALAGYFVGEAVKGAGPRPHLSVVATGSPCGDDPGTPASIPTRWWVDAQGRVPICADQDVSATACLGLGSERRANAATRSGTHVGWCGVVALVLVEKRTDQLGPLIRRSDQRLEGGAHDTARGGAGRACASTEQSRRWPAR